MEYWSLLLGENPSRAEEKAVALLADRCSGLGVRCRVQWGGELPEGPSYRDRRKKAHG